MQGRERSKSRTYRYSGKRVLHSEGLDVVRELLESLSRGSITLSSQLDKVLEELGSGFDLDTETDRSCNSSVSHHQALHGGERRRDSRNLNSTVKEIGHNLHLGLEHTPTRQRVGTDTHSTGYRRTLVTRDGVLVEGDMSEIANLLNLGSGQAERSEIPQDEMVIRSRSLQLVVVREQDFGDRLGVGEDLGRVVSECLRVDLLESNGDGGDGL